VSYELAIADEAFEDIERLIDSLPEARRAEAVAGVDEALQRLAANPLLAPKLNLGRPTYRFQFTAGGVGYHWAATFASLRTSAASS
jgi:hypothetical protein